MLHHQHRNPSTPAGFTNEMLINDSVVHEFDAIRYFTGEESPRYRSARQGHAERPGRAARPAARSD